VTSGIRFFSENIDFRLKDQARLRKWIKGIIEQEGKTSGEIIFIFCDDDYLLELNQTFLKRDTLTDVIAFPYGEKPGVISGDIFISVIRINENARKFSQTFEEELHRVMIHGTLHLSGYDDKTKRGKEEMTAKENRYLAQLP
jgi:probable rRNA maturation factor